MNMNIYICFIIFIIIIIIFYYINTKLNNKYDLFKNNTKIYDVDELGKIKCFEGDKTICSSFSNKEYFEKNISKLLLKYYKPNTVFLDIGANYGIHSIFIGNNIKKNNQTGKIYSFEIQDKIFNLLKENVDMNNLNNIINLNHFGLGNKNENIEFKVPNDYDMDDNPGSISIANQRQNKDYIKQNIEIKTLDSLNLNNISLIKLDVESFELEVLEGGINTISKNKPIIFIEIWEKNKKKYFDWIDKNLNYKLLEHISSDDYIFIHK